MHDQMIHHIINGDTNALETMLRDGCSANTKASKSQNPALVTAIMKDQPECFRLLLRHGADVELAAADGTTPIFVAILRK